MHLIFAAQGSPLDPHEILRQGSDAGGGWWAALTVLIVVICGGYLMRYFISRHEVLVQNLRESNGETIRLLTGVVTENTKAHAANGTELHSMRVAVDQLQRVVDNKLVARRDSHG